MKTSYNSFVGLQAKQKSSLTRRCTKENVVTTPQLDLSSVHLIFHLRAIKWLLMLLASFNYQVCYLL